MVPEKLNAYLRTLMSGLTAKVFRTYNASRTLDMLLQDTDPDDKIQAKLVFYNRCNRDVAILCNHQRARPKGFDESLEKVDAGIKDAEDKYKQAKRDYHRAKENREPKPQQDKYKRQVHLLKERLEDKKSKRQTKVDLATVALGTSKTNYLDPRITVAWCNKHEVPISKVFAKTLVSKFPWAMDASAEWRFEFKDCPEGAEGDTSKRPTRDSDDDDDDVPLAKKTKMKAKPKSTPIRKKKPPSDDESDDDDDMPLAKRKVAAKKKDDDEDDEDDEEDMPLSKRKALSPKDDKAAAPAKRKKEEADDDSSDDDDDMPLSKRLKP